MDRVFIINPESGKRISDDISSEITKICKEDKLDYKIYVTEKPGHATEITRSYSENQNIIYSVGGDGTNLEVVNGIVNTNNYMAMIPCGSGNDFYATIENNDNDIIRSDIGTANDKYFLNIASVGIDAEIANRVKELRNSNLPVPLRYKYALLEMFFKYQGISAKVDSDDETKKDLTLVTICNGTQYGNGFKIAPNAKIDDGLFDIYLAEKLSKPQIIKLILKLLKGTHEESKYITKWQSPSIEITSTCGPLVYNLDGEVYKDETISFGIHPAAIKLYNTNDKFKELVKKIRR